MVILTKKSVNPVKICLTLLVFFVSSCCLIGQDTESQKYSYIVDKRDQQTYRTIQIGDQVWMADNLNYTSENSFCYLDDTNHCNQFGRLYKFKAALNACPAGDGICPLMVSGKNLKLKWE